MMTNTYIIILGHSDEPYVCEREVKDCTWEATVRDISDLQFENLRSVIEIGSGEDCTERALTEALTRRSHNDADYSHKLFVLAELHLGTRAARSFLRAG